MRKSARLQRKVLRAAARPWRGKIKDEVGEEPVSLLGGWTTESSEVLRPAMCLLEEETNFTIEMRM